MSRTNVHVRATSAQQGEAIVSDGCPRPAKSKAGGWGDGLWGSLSWPPRFPNSHGLIAALTAITLPTFFLYRLFVHWTKSSSWPHGQSPAIRSPPHLAPYVFSAQGTASPHYPAKMPSFVDWIGSWHGIKGFLLLQPRCPRGGNLPGGRTFCDRTLKVGCTLNTYWWPCQTPPRRTKNIFFESGR